MSIGAINTARLQSFPSANVRGGTAAAANSGVTKKDKAQEQQQKPKPKSNSPDLTQVIHHVGLQFSVHDDTGETVVRVVDKDTGELIRQIPPQELLDLAAKLEEMMGILFDKQV
jgi:flagellar protein FlaG